MTPRQIAAVLAPLAFFALANARAAANSLGDYLGPREVAMGEAMRVNAIGATATVLNPAGLSLTRELVFEGSWGYRPKDGASLLSLSACDSTVVIPGCFYYRYFAANPLLGGAELRRRAHEVGSVASRAITSRLRVGLSAKYFDYESDIGGQEASNGLSVDGGLLVVASHALSFAVVGYNLVAAPSSQYPRGWAAGLGARLAPALTMEFDALWNLEASAGIATGRYGGGGEYFFSSSDRQRGYPVRAGAVYDAQKQASYLTAGVGLVTARLGIDIGARTQVSGGSEVLFQASLRVFGPRLPASGNQATHRRPL